jgi:hypothetical protein
MKCSKGLPLHEKRDVPSGMTPLPWVVLILPQRFVFPDLHSLHSLHSGLLDGIVSSDLIYGDAVGVCLGIGMNILEGNDSLARLDICHSRSDAFDDTSTFMS